MSQQTPLYIITSPRPQMGKTLLARLLIEFLRSSDRPLVGFDLNPREPTLAGHFPRLVWTVDIADTRGQMAMFDMLIADGTNTKVIDLGYTASDQFFSIMGQIGFVQEARRRRIEPIVLFITDTADKSVLSYAELQRRLTAVTFVPVHNESVSLLFSKEDFPPTRAEYGIVHIPRLSPIVRGVIDRPSFSVSNYIGHQPGGPTEIHAWIETIFTEFREFELRLLMGRLNSSLGRAPAQPRKSKTAR